MAQRQCEGLPAAHAAAVFESLLPTFAQQGLSVDGATDFSALLVGPPLPAAGAYLWAWFAELHAGRTVSALGPTRATHLDLWAWQANARLRCGPWEIRMLTALGDAWVAAMSDAPVAEGDE